MAKGAREGRSASVADGAAALARVLEATRRDVEAARSARDEKNARLTAAGKKAVGFKPELSFAIYFAKYIGQEIAAALRPDFPEVRSGETPSESVRGPKRVDLNYSTPEAGLGFAVSFKSVHFGEKEHGDASFTHNLKRNDEELRVEATAHHLRQPYAVLAAVVFLPFEACTDFDTSSFASWVEYLWPLKGRQHPEDAPDRFELVFIALYARDGSELGFYEVGGATKCPRTGRPARLLSLAEFVRRLKVTYDRRNGRDFFFEGEEPET
jgi:hypothetical protein